MAQIDADLLGVLINKPEALSLRLLTVMALCALHSERQILILLSDSAEQFQSSLRIFVVGIESALQMWRRQREAHIGDHTEAIVLIPIINGPRLLIVARQHHLGSSAHSQRGSMGVECLCGEVLTLHQNIIVEVGENGGVETNAILHQQDHLHAALADVVVNIESVLDELDDGEDEVGVAQPAEHIVEDAQILVLHTARDAVAERGEHHAGDRCETGLDGTRHVESIIVCIAWHANDKVYADRTKYLLCLLDRRNLRKRGRIAQAKARVFIINFLLHASVILQHEGVIGVSDDEDVVDAAHHEIDERDVFHDEFAPFVG